MKDLEVNGMVKNRNVHNKNENNKIPGSGNQYHESHTSNALGYGENSQLAREQMEQDTTNENR